VNQTTINFLETIFVKAHNNACGMKLPIPSNGKIWDNKLIHFYGEYYSSKDRNNNLNGIITKDFDIRREVR